MSSGNAGRNTRNKGDSGLTRGNRADGQKTHKRSQTGEKSGKRTKEMICKTRHMRGELQNKTGNNPTNNSNETMTLRSSRTCSQDPLFSRVHCLRRKPRQN